MELRPYAEAGKAQSTTEQAGRSVLGKRSLFQGKGWWRALWLLTHSECCPGLGAQCCKFSSSRHQAAPQSCAEPFPVRPGSAWSRSRGIKVAEPGLTQTLGFLDWDPPARPWVWGCRIVLRVAGCPGLGGSHQGCAGWCWDCNALLVHRVLVSAPMRSAMEGFLLGMVVGGRPGP